MGTFGGDRTRYRYEDRADPLEETTEHTTRDASLNEDTLRYMPGTSHIQHTRFEYIYDAHRNWTSKKVWLRAFAKTQHWSVVHEYVDRTSGKRCDGEQFQKMFGAASRREFDVLVFWSLDRLSRADQTRKDGPPRQLGGNPSSFPAIWTNLRLSARP
jgi:hypothetical protein